MELVLKRIGKVLIRALFKLAVLMIFWQMYLHLNPSACNYADISSLKQIFLGKWFDQIFAQNGFTPRG